MRQAFLALAMVASLVACSGDEEIVTIPVDGSPSAVEVVDGTIWVADDDRDAVHVVDPGSREIVRSIDVSENPIALAGRGRTVWVAHSDGRIAVIDTRTKELRGRLVDTGGDLTDITQGVATDVDRGLFRIGLDEWIEIPDGAVRAIEVRRTIWVSGRENVVTRVEDGELTTFEVGSGPIGLTSDGTDVWVANSDDDTIQTVDGDRVVSVGNAPVALAAAGKTIWVANQDDGTVSRVSPNNEVETIDVGTTPRGIAVGEGAVWIVGVNESALVRVVL